MTAPGRVRAIGLGIAALALGASVAACGPDIVASAPPATPGPTPAGPRETLPPPATGSAEPESAAPATASAGAGATRRDDPLLSVLPPDIDGVAIEPEAEAFADATADGAFTANVERAAFFVVARDTDLASGLVAAFREGRFGDTTYQDWRETYNEGVCAQAGGVQTTAETTMAGRPVWITTCAGGIRVYHAYLQDRGLLVSVFSLGEGRFGERIMGDLRP